MSLRERNNNINAMTDRNPKIPVIDAEILKILIVVQLEFYYNTIILITNDAFNLMVSRQTAV